MKAADVWVVVVCAAEVTLQRAVAGRRSDGHRQPHVGARADASASPIEGFVGVGVAGGPRLIARAVGQGRGCRGRWRWGLLTASFSPL